MVRELSRPRSRGFIMRKKREKDPLAELRRANRKGWIVLLVILAVIGFAVLELGQHTLLGWGLTNGRNARLEMMRQLP